MFKSKSGKSFGSAYVAKRHDDEADKKAQSIMGGEGQEHEAAETPEFEKGEQEGMNEAPEQVAKEHGPATTVHIAHDHKNKKHHVVSTHKDGHVHSSDHGSANEAHDHAAALSAGGDQPSAEGMEHEGAPEADGFQMPKLA